MIGILICLSLYNLGNRALREGDYEKAVDCYLQALETDQDPRIYYNLGVAYYKLGRIGPAIKATRLAWRLDPKDPDIRYNLDFLRSYRADQIDRPLNPIIRLLDSIFHYFSYYEATLFSGIAFLLFSLLLAGYIITKSRILIRISILPLLIFLFFFINRIIWVREFDPANAVIVEGEVVAYSGPGEGNKEVFLVHDGLEVRIIEKREGFCLIQIPGGFGGWVRQEALSPILP